MRANFILLLYLKFMLVTYSRSAKQWSDGHIVVLSVHTMIIQKSYSRTVII